MQSMNISLPEPLKQFVEMQIASGRYSSASEYVRELIRDDERRRAEERLEAFLLRRLESPASEWTQGDVDHIKNAVQYEQVPAPASSSARAAARAKLLAAGLLATDIHAPAGTVRLSDVEIAHMGALSAGSRPSEELVAEDRGLY